MTVRELIDKLQMYNQDAIVLSNNDKDGSFVLEDILEGVFYNEFNGYGSFMREDDYNNERQYYDSDEEFLEEMGEYVPAIHFNLDEGY